MPDNREEELYEPTLDETFDDEITNEDYGFVFDAEGNLKSVFMPENGFDVPERVLKVFQMCGIEDPHGVYVHTIH